MFRWHGRLSQLPQALSLAFDGNHVEEKATRCQARYEGYGARFALIFEEQSEAVFIGRAARLAKAGPQRARRFRHKRTPSDQAICHSFDKRPGGRLYCMSIQRIRLVHRADDPSLAPQDADRVALLVELKTLISRLGSTIAEDVGMIVLNAEDYIESGVVTVKEEDLDSHSGSRLQEVVRDMLVKKEDDAANGSSRTEWHAMNREKLHLKKEETS